MEGGGEVGGWRERQGRRTHCHQTGHVEKVCLTKRRASANVTPLFGPNNGAYNQARPHVEQTVLVKTVCRQVYVYKHVYQAMGKIFDLTV